MPANCLICDSKAVLSKEVANVAVMLIGTIESVLVGMNHSRTRKAVTTPMDPPESQLAVILELIGTGMSEALSGCSAITAFANDVQKHQFGHYDFLCCRCGARFDENSSAAPHNG
jgi:hypothetical protein